jgi:zinc transport system substrate-binding protein
MAGIGTPDLLLKGGASPHDYALRPSDARRLAAADVVVWVGRDLEMFLAKPLATLAHRARVVAVGSVGDLGGAADPHVWLDPRNARAIVDRVADALTVVDPDHAGVYADNAAKMRARLAVLDDALARDLAPVRDLPYIVFHDAYRYFERRYGLNQVGAVVLNPQRRPGARRIAELRRLIQARDARCVFREPQFQSRIIRTLVEGTDARIGVLDPLGGALPAGEAAYFDMMHGLVRAMTDCLRG